MNGQPAPAAIVGTFPMPVGTRFEWHSHGDHQLAWSPEGVLVVLTEGGGSYVLPPSRALWIPAGTVHETRASGAAVLRSVYVEPRRCPIDWDGADAGRGQSAPRRTHPSPRRPRDRQPRNAPAPRPSSSTSWCRSASRRSTSDSPADPARARRRRRAPRRSRPIPARCTNGDARSARAAARSRAPSSTTPGSRSGAGARSSACRRRCCTSPSRCR